MQTQMATSGRIQAPNAEIRFYSALPPEAGKPRHDDGVVASSEMDYGKRLKNYGCPLSMKRQHSCQIQVRSRMEIRERGVECDCVLVR
jgi:hypothetical protein